MKTKFTFSLLALALASVSYVQAAPTFQPFVGLKTDAFKVSPRADLDGDGVPDWFDDDIDGDGISNDYEMRLGFNPRDAKSTPPDFDGDGIPDALDPDIDNDGVPNDKDAFPYDRSASAKNLI